MCFYLFFYWIITWYLYWFFAWMEANLTMASICYTRYQCFHINWLIPWWLMLILEKKLTFLFLLWLVWGEVSSLSWFHLLSFYLIIRLFLSVWETMIYVLVESVVILTHSLAAKFPGQRLLPWPDLIQDLCKGVTLQWGGRAK